MPRVSKLVVVASCVAVLLVPSLTAERPAGIGESMDRAGWVTLTIEHSSATPIRARAIADSARAPASVGIALYDAAGRYIFSTEQTLRGMKSGFYASIEAENARFSVDELTTAGSPLGISATLEATVSSGRYHLLAWSAGNLSAGWSLTVEHGAADRIMASERGENDTRLLVARDFRGLASAELHHTLVGSARANVQGSIAYRAERPFMYRYSIDNPPPPTSVDIAEASTPTGTIRCPCSSFDLAGPSAAAPGDYTFRLSGAGVQLLSRGHPELLVVPARLPPEPR